MVLGTIRRLSLEYDGEDVILALRSATSARERGGGCRLNCTLGLLRLLEGRMFSSDVEAEVVLGEEKELNDESCP